MRIIREKKSEQILRVLALDHIGTICAALIQVREIAMISSDISEQCLREREHEWYFVWSFVWKAMHLRRSLRSSSQWCGMRDLQHKIPRRLPSSSCEKRLGLSTMRYEHQHATGLTNGSDCNIKDNASVRDSEKIEALLNMILRHFVTSRKDDADPISQVCCFTPLTIHSACKKSI